MHQVSVVAARDADGQVQFTPDGEVWNHSGGVFRFHKDHHGMKKHDYHLVEFMLTDETGDGLRFPHSPHDAMWVAAVDDPANPVCPDQNTQSDYEVLEPICVCDEGQRLIVRNHNPREEQWAFTLNFVKAGANDSDASQYVSWDPITDNRNGGAA